MELKHASFVIMLVLALSAGVVTSAATEDPANPAADQLKEQLKQLKQQAHEARSEIQQLKRQVMKDPAIQQSQDEYDRMVKERVQAIDNEGVTARLEQLKDEMRELMKKEAQLRKKVMEDPDVKAAGDQLEEKIEARIVEMNPDAAQTLARQEQIEAEMKQKMQELRGQNRPKREKPEGERKPREKKERPEGQRKEKKDKAEEGAEM
jgi:Ni,Fe-hydrogenase III large subunit